MRFIGVCSVAALAAFATSANASAAKRITDRRAEIISMGLPQAIASEVKDPGGVQKTPSSPAAAAAFTVHDLPRRSPAPRTAGRVEATKASQVAADLLKAFVPTDETPTRVVEIPRAAMLTVPPWMLRPPAPSLLPAYQFACTPPAYRPTGFLRSDAEVRRAAYYEMMGSAACEHGIPVALFDAMIIRESQYRPDVYSVKNAFGLTQLMPGTAAALGVNRYSIEGNLRGGARYLRQQLDRFGHYHLALAAYNAGPGRVKGGRVPAIAETRAYVDNVLANWSRLSSYIPDATFDTSANLRRIPPRQATVNLY